jgi:Breast carcinoma amplified sequence 2 (BCAS2)
MPSELQIALVDPEGVQNRDDGNMLDALPYIDDANYSEEHRQFALRLIQAECQDYRPKKNYLSNLPHSDPKQFLTPMILDEHKRIADKKVRGIQEAATSTDVLILHFKEMEKIDLHRYEVPSPANTSKAGDKKAWQSAINNCKAQLANQSLRQTNLELMDEYGPEAFKHYNLHLQKSAEKEEADVNKVTRLWLWMINT